jgi:hypothetical protein
MITLCCSEHSFIRARERNGWSATTLNRMVERIFHAGLVASECKGHLRQYLATLPHDASLHRVRIYGEQIYLFDLSRPDEAILITLYPLPTTLRASARNAFRHQNALAA